jgi:hypothetical protein
MKNIKINSERFLLAFYGVSILIVISFFVSKANDEGHSTAIPICVAKILSILSFPAVQVMDVFLHESRAFPSLFFTAQIINALF